MNEQIKSKQKVVLTDRRDLEIDGVESILAFDDGYVSISTAEGRLIVEGEGLKVDNLSKTDGRIHIVGCVSAFYFSDGSKRSGLSKIFK